MINKYLSPKVRVKRIKKVIKDEVIWFDLHDRKLIKKVRGHLKKLAYAGCEIDFDNESWKVEDKYRAYVTRFNKALKVVSPSVPNVKIVRLQHPRHFVDVMCMKAHNPKAILKAVRREKTSKWVKESKEIIKQFDSID